MSEVNNNLFGSLAEKAKEGLENLGGSVAEQASTITNGATENLTKSFPDAAFSPEDVTLPKPDSKPELNADDSGSISETIGKIGEVKDDLTSGNIGELKNDAEDALSGIKSGVSKASEIADSIKSNLGHTGETGAQSAA